jgi:hypothetical protein
MVANTFGVRDGEQITWFVALIAELSPCSSSKSSWATLGFRMPVEKLAELVVLTP